MNELLRHCTLCPRNCGVDRSKALGYCRSSDKLKAARAALHFWEEPCLSGTEGSGTVFFSGCSLGCVYCQNREIALVHTGKLLSQERLTEIFLELQAQGANNINLVTAGHEIPLILPALDEAKKKGLHIPIVYNSGGYEKEETIRMLEGYVDIYLPDLKYMSSELSARYSNAPDYFFYASRAIGEMVRQAGAPEFDSRGMLRRGVIVRHLALPGGIEDSKQVLRYLYDNYGNQIYISIMNQYTPQEGMPFPELSRTLSQEEYEELVNYAVDIGIEQGFIQEGGTAEESFIPAFDCEGI